MFAAIANTFANCFKIPELRSRIWFTLIILAVCRLAALVPIPGLDNSALKAYFEEAARTGGGNSLVSLYSLFTGGGFERCALGALGIMPYISATIIIQLLAAVLPRLSKMAREEGGRVKIIQYGRYLAVLLALGQGFIMSLGWENPAQMFGDTWKAGDKLVLIENLWLYRFQTAFFLAAGTVLLMWLGEQITDRGIGNGVSLVITVGILARLPQAFQGLWRIFFPPEGIESRMTVFHGLALLILLVAVVAAVVLVVQGQRKIPVQYAQRAVGRKVISGGNSFMPLRVNYAGVMPVIFAQAILMFPAWMFGSLAKQVSGSGNLSRILNDLSRWMTEPHPLYLFAFGAMILFFSYFWVATQFNELQIADDMKKSGGYIPGVRPGPATSDFLRSTMSKITLAGAVFLTVIAVIPIVLGDFFGIDNTVTSFFGGTSMLITVGVVLDTMRQMESYLLMRHYDGFLKKGRIKGRF
jgi:preprotein translocase subunit SecY